MRWVDQFSTWLEYYPQKIISTQSFCLQFWCSFVCRPFYNETIRFFLSRHKTLSRVVEVRVKQITCSIKLEDGKQLQEKQSRFFPVKFLKSKVSLLNLLNLQVLGNLKCRSRANIFLRHTANNLQPWFYTFVLGVCWRTFFG